MTMIAWTSAGNRLDARSPSKGGPFASVVNEGDRWVVVWWVGPKGRTLVPSLAKGRAWVERFAGKRVEALGRKAASPGVGPAGSGGYAPPTQEEQARYDAFAASYDPSRAKKRRRAVLNANRPTSECCEARRSPDVADYANSAPIGPATVRRRRF
jgi:hypothetical protein